MSVKLIDSWQRQIYTAQAYPLGPFPVCGMRYGRKSLILASSSCNCGDAMISTNPNDLRLGSTTPSSILLEDTFTGLSGTPLNFHPMDVGPGWTGGGPFFGPNWWLLSGSSSVLPTNGTLNIALADAGVNDNIIMQVTVNDTYIPPPPPIGGIASISLLWGFNQVGTSGMQIEISMSNDPTAADFVYLIQNYNFGQTIIDTQSFFPGNTFPFTLTVNCFGGTITVTTPAWNTSFGDTGFRYGTYAGMEGVIQEGPSGHVGFFSNYSLTGSAIILPLGGICIPCSKPFRLQADLDGQITEAEWFAVVKPGVNVVMYESYPAEFWGEEVAAQHVLGSVNSPCRNRWGMINSQLCVHRSLKRFLRIVEHED